MDIEEAKYILIELSTYDYVKLENGDTAIETVLSELEKKEAIINLMAKQLAKLRENGEEDCFVNQHINVCVTKYKTCEECIKEYFEKKEGKNNDKKSR